MEQRDETRRAGHLPYTRLVGSMIDQIPIAIALFDHDLRCVQCNARWITEFGTATAEQVRDPVNHDSTTLPGRWRHYLAQALNGEASSSDLDRSEGPDGKIVWTRWSISPWRDAKGKIWGAMLLCEDMSAGVKRRLRTKVLEEELSLVSEGIEGIAVSMLDDDGQITIWNSGAKRLTGWDETEILGQNHSILFDQEDRTNGLPATQLQLARTNGTFRNRCWRIHKDGTRFCADVMISRIEGDELLPSGFGQILRDVTHEELQARSLEANAVLLKAILETSPDGLVVIDTDGKILLVSAAVEEMFGYQEIDIAGKNVSVLMNEDDRQNHHLYMKRYQETGQSSMMGQARRLLGQRKDGTEFPLSLRLAEAFGGGQLVIVGFMQDLTSKEANEYRLEQLQRELAHFARVNEMGTLASTIAHELNQPLMAVTNIVQTAVQILRDGMVAEQENLAVALELAGHEALRAGDILRRLRAFLSRGELEKTLEDACKIARDAVSLAASGSIFRSISCIVECPPDLQPILVDRVQIQQVILNLVRNATQSVGANGKVIVRITPDDGQMRFSVIDTGPGVPHDRVERLFEPFSTTKSNGMGMGLPICRTIIEAHGGRIWYQPGEDTGAIFTFTLPIFNEEADYAR